MVRTCPHCGCSEIDEDAARGDSTCTGCGTVLEENVVVSENQFQERAGGSGHTLVGQFLSMDRAQKHTLQGVPGLNSQESREVTFQKGRKLIEEVGSQLRISTHCIDTAFNFFKMCVSRNLTRGRVRSHVVSACMYMTCRLENTPHLLLDFSDVTQVNVFDLGRTLSFLSRSLRINLPTTDPCLYIMRFACSLEFGDKEKDVVNLSTRLVQRMKRDWMATGRRPTGLCGAALLIAARAYNFNRTIADVVRVVQISEAVVRKRLDEFGQTPSGSLTIDEFASIDLEHSEDPPAYREARRKAKEQQAKEDILLDRMQTQLQPIEEELEKALEKKRREKFKNTKFAREVAGNLDDPEVGAAEAALLRNEIIDSVFAVADDSSVPLVNNFAEYRPTLQSLGINVAQTNYCLADYPIQPPSDNPNGDLNLEGIDDDEIESYILTDAESALKERFWMKNNGEHVKEMERRKREREEQEEKDKDNPTRKKKRRTNVARTGEVTTSATAVEAMERIINEKRLSNKVNYDILKEIESDDPIVTQQGKSMEVQGVNRIIAKIETIEKPSDIFTNGGSVEELSRREKEVKRKNASHSSVLHLSTLNSALKVGSSIVTETVQDKKPSLFSSSRRPFGRARPNMRVSSVKREPIAQSDDVTPDATESTERTVVSSNQLSFKAPVAKLSRTSFLNKPKIKMESVMKTEAIDIPSSFSVKNETASDTNRTPEKPVKQANVDTVELATDSVSDIHKISSSNPSFSGSAEEPIPSIQIPQRQENPQEPSAPVTILRRKGKQGPMLRIPTEQEDSTSVRSSPLNNIESSETAKPVTLSRTRKPGPQLKIKR